MKAACFAFLLLSLLSGCCYSERAAKRRAESVASGQCVVHHLPLENVVCYHVSDKYCLMPGDFNAIDKEEFRFPNALPFGYWTKPSKTVTEKEVLQCCPSCMQRLDS